MLGAVALAACSPGGASDSTGASDGSGPREAVQDLERPSSVSEAAWTWEAPEGVGALGGLFPVPGGVAAVMDDGAIALSGENGGVMWEHRFPDTRAFGAVSGQGQYFTLQLMDTEDDEARPRMLVIDASTGETVHDYRLEDEESSGHVVRGWLANVTDEHWITVEGEQELVAHRLGTDETAWSVPDVAACNGVGSVDRAVVTDGTLVAAFTCYDQPEGETSVEMTEGQEFVSGYSGFDPATGEELWRTEATAGMFAADAHERTLTVHASGVVTAYHPYGRIGHVVDQATGEVVTVDEGDVVWTEEDGSLRGVWTDRTHAYRIEGPDGQEQRRLGTDEIGIAESFANALQGDDAPVALEDGVLLPADLIPRGENEAEAAVFQGFDGAVPITLASARETNLEFDDAVLAPGTVAVSYISHSGQGVVIGLH
ncbi:PQQ-binding-like beta-propeller repeat protein [Nocardiopsis sp. CC223A]|uniref:outer membrane protein assembly factor BamB family protein n=1 Tax=Nocardiopsis sp. CC223A TaxID=3044051 RepID=UPI00278C7A76|nr:PQQ-binding-like beta-propeller repeat protein [Nocardiopsis sp. CC223A]